MTKYYLVFLKNIKPWQPLARLIEIVEGKDYSHCEIMKVVDDDFDNAEFLGAQLPKSRVCSKKEIEEKYKIKYVVPLIKKVDDKKAEAIFNSLKDIDYSLVQLALIGLKILTKGVFAWLNGIKLNLTKYVVCTEVCGIFMQEACQYRFSISPEMLSLDEIEDIAVNAWAEVE